MQSPTSLPGAADAPAPPLPPQTEPLAARPERRLGGIFVWALEGGLFALLGWALYASFRGLGVLPSHSMHEWVLVTTAGSALAHGVAQCVVAFRRKNETLEQDTLNAALHHGLAQANCCVVFLTLLLYTVVWMEAQQRSQWMLVFFSASPSTLLVVGATVLAFTVVMLIVVVCNAFAATAIGNSNWLFVTPSVVLLLGIVYPFLHEIGDRELLLCTDTGTNSIAIVLLNSGLLVSYTLFVLDTLNFDPLRAFDGTVLQARWDVGLDPKLRIYLLLHALFVALWLSTYLVVARTVSTVLWVALLAAVSLAAGASFGAWPEWRARTYSSTSFMGLVRAAQGAGRFKKGAASRETPTSVLRGEQSSARAAIRLRPRAAERAEP